MDIERIATTDAPTPAGHYSQATVHEGLMYVAGQIPVRPDGTHTYDASFEEQARQALANLLAIVRAGGSAPELMLKVNVYIVDIAHWPAFNKVYAELMGEARPARAVIPVPELHHGYLVEIDAIAAR
jgi:2-iminobutanoate/2-iminopropanoate deaminase